jgi:hypothetical protein
MARFKVQAHGISKVISENFNRDVIAFQTGLLEKACAMPYLPDEAILNLCLHRWHQGQLLDEEFCREIKIRIFDQTTAWWICLIFRKALGLSVNLSEENSLV